MSTLVEKCGFLTIQSICCLLDQYNPLQFHSCSIYDGTNNLVIAKSRDGCVMTEITFLSKLGWTEWVFLYAQDIIFTSNSVVDKRTKKFSRVLTFQKFVHLTKWAYV